MTIRPKALTEFKNHYKQDFGVELTDQEAMEMGSNLVNAIGFLVYPDRFPIDFVGKELQE